MTEKEILLSKIEKKSICVLTLNNPVKRNPLSIELIENLQKKFDEIKKDKAIKVVVLKSTGPSFSSGHDLKEVSKYSKSSKKLNLLFNKCSKMMLSIRSLPQPVIASIDGLAAAACHYFQRNDSSSGKSYSSWSSFLKDNPDKLA